MYHCLVSIDHCLAALLDRKTMMEVLGRRHSDPRMRGPGLMTPEGAKVCRLDLATGKRAMMGKVKLSNEGVSISKRRNADHEGWPGIRVSDQTRQQHHRLISGGPDDSR